MYERYVKNEDVDQSASFEKDAKKRHRIQMMKFYMTTNIINKLIELIRTILNYQETIRKNYKKTIKKLLEIIKTGTMFYGLMLAK